MTPNEAKDFGIVDDVVAAGGRRHRTTSESKAGTKEGKLEATI